MLVPTVSAIYVYPIKSLRGVQLDSAWLEKRGFQHDRRWMLVNSKGTFLTQRKIRRMALFDTAIGDRSLTVSLEGHGSIEVPYVHQGERRLVRIWRSKVLAET